MFWFTVSLLGLIALSHLSGRAFEKNNHLIEMKERPNITRFILVSSGVIFLAFFTAIVVNNSQQPKNKLELSTIYTAIAMTEFQVEGEDMITLVLTETSETKDRIYFEVQKKDYTNIFEIKPDSSFTVAKDNASKKKQIIMQ